jgi:hypothetical protein
MGTGSETEQLRDHRELTTTSSFVCVAADSVVHAPRLTE